MTTMPLKATRAALLGLPRVKRLTVAAIGGHKNRNPSITQLAATIGLGRSTIVAAIRELEADGVLVAKRPTKRDRKTAKLIGNTTYLLADEYEPNDRAAVVTGVEVEKLIAARGEASAANVLDYALLRAGLGDAAETAMQLPERTMRRVRAAMRESGRAASTGLSEDQKAKVNIEDPRSITASQPYLKTFKNRGSTSYLGSGQSRSAHDRLEGLIEGLEELTTTAVHRRPGAHDTRRQTAQRGRAGDRPAAKAGSRR